MIRFIYGPSGYGKSAMLADMIAHDAENGVTSYLFVPEQEAVSAERNTLRILPSSAQLSFEVLNFSRLANKLFRLEGGLSYNYITSGMKSILMWRNLAELAPLLCEYGERAASDPSMVALMLSAVKEFKMYGVSPASLETAAMKLPEKSSLRSKLLDLTLVYASFEGLIEEKYSDSLDDLSKAAEILKSTNYFKNSNVYIDSFTSFTSSELRIISYMFSKAANVTVALCTDAPDSTQIHFKSVCDTSKLLRELASSYKTEEIYLKENKRTSSSALKELEKRIWNYEKPADMPKIALENASRTISLVECENIYEESEMVANKISELVRLGYRYRDIAVIAREASSYSGVIDAAFEKAGIPFFLSEKTDLSSKPLQKFLLSAFRIKMGNWKRSDIISHIKTGIYNISERDADMFEEYVSTWNLSGKRFVNGEWTMNPDGYKSELTERGARILTSANSVRETIIAPLLEFFTYIDSADDTRELCRAVYNFIDKLNVKDNLSSLSKKYLTLGKRREADETVRLYNVTISVLEDIASILGDEKLTPEEFFTVLKIAFDCADIGSIPTSSDEVSVSSANMFRADNVKVAIVIGMCDEEFPKNITDSGLLDSQDKKALHEFDISLSADALTRNTEEMFYVYRAMTSASERLYLCYPSSTTDGKSKKPSVAFEKVKSIFPSLRETKYASMPCIDKMWDKNTSFDNYNGINDKEVVEALGGILADIPDFARKLSQLNIPISDRNETLDKSTSEQLFERKIRLSPSSLEKYVKCHFRYFCENVLQLRSGADDSFDGSDRGTFIHNILEKFMEKAVHGKVVNTSLSDEEIYEIVNEIIQKYIAAVCPDQNAASGRLYAYFMRLRALAIVAIRGIMHEIAQSDFAPSFFEMNFGKGNQNGVAPPTFTLDDGTAVTISGTLDRADLYEKDGKVYVRIIDYKTGSMSFDIKKISHGLNLQMLLYLFAICRSDSKEIKATADASPDAELLPAGITYFVTKLPSLNTESIPSEEEILDLAEKSLSRSGLVLNDEDILQAINHSLDPKYLLGTKRGKDGEFAGPSAISPEQFCMIEAQIDQTVCDIAKELKSGAADALPMRGENACDYCDMKPVCRSHTPKKND